MSTSNQKGPVSPRFTAEQVTELARKFTTLKDFRRANPGAHNYAWRHGLLKEFTWLEKKRRPCGTITREHCMEVARKFTSVSEFRKEAMTEYVAASMHGWLQDYTWLTKKNRPWTQESVTELARQCNTMGDFYREHRRAYNYAFRQGLLDTFTWLVKKTGNWNRESVVEAAKKYDSLGDFYRNDNAAYQYAWKYGMLDDFRWLSRKRRKNRTDLKTPASRG